MKALEGYGGGGYVWGQQQDPYDFFKTMIDCLAPGRPLAPLGNFDAEGEKAWRLAFEGNYRLRTRRLVKKYAGNCSCAERVGADGLVYDSAGPWEDAFCISVPAPTEGTSETIAKLLEQECEQEHYDGQDKLDLCSVCTLPLQVLHSIFFGVVKLTVYPVKEVLRASLALSAFSTTRESRRW